MKQFMQFMSWERKYEDEMDANLKQKVDGRISKMEADFKAYKKDMAAKKSALQTSPPLSPAPAPPAPPCPGPGSAQLCAQQDQTPQPLVGDQAPEDAQPLVAVSKSISIGGHYLFTHLRQKEEEENRAMQLQVTNKDKQIRTESSQLLMVVTAVDWEQAEDNQIQEDMTKVRGWETRGYSHIKRNFWEYERMARAIWDRDRRNQPGSEYNNLKV